VEAILALKGYFNGREFISLEKVTVKTNQKVIITVLDEYIDALAVKEKPYKKYVGKLSNDNYNELTEVLKETEKVDSNEW
jgi:hypothetical protein